MKRQFNRAGFTLIEMALVLAIIGLIVGGIMGGQVMMRNMQVNRVLRDVVAYTTAKDQFRQQYDYLPGDLPTATQIWGDNAAVCASASTVDGNPGTCNGDGDGYLLYAVAPSGTSENFQYWNQLALAGFISGKYSGLNGPNGPNYEAIPGVNSPSMSVSGAVLWLYGYWAIQPASGTFYAGDYTNVMVFGGVNPGTWPSVGVITPAEAYGIDKKVDDGYPGLGSVRTMAQSWMGGGCVSSDTASIATYLPSTNGNVCLLLFLRDFMAKQSQ